MNFILVIVMSSAMFLPESFTITPFDSMKNCEIALREAKKQWSTVNIKSKCVDLKLSQKVFEAQKELQKAIDGR